MGVFNKVLIPYDGSEPSKRAAEKALELAEDQGAEVAGLKVISFTGEVISPSDRVWDTIESNMEEKARDLLGDLEDMASDRGIDVELEVMDGSPESSIVDFAEDWGADLIVLGKHGKHGVGKALLGSTVSRVLRKAPCTVMVER